MKLNQVAAQLYTVRDHCRTSSGLAASARKIRDMGYAAVQVSGIGPIPDDEVRAICDGEGLVICATHEPSATIRKDPQAAIDRIQRLGTRLAAYPFPADVNFADPRSVSELITDLENAGRHFARAGLTLSYHNHAIEFLRVGGKTVLEGIFERTDPAHLKAELDTYWVQYGGGDPATWCARLAGRLPAIHLKDYGFTVENKPTFAEIGRGNLDFPGIIAAADRSGCQWYIVEQDVCPGDPFESLRLSLDYLRTLPANS